MARYDFRREVRTPYSECYIVSERETVVGRLDIHYTDDTVHASLNIEESVDPERIRDLLDGMAEDLLEAVGIARRQVLVHIHQGRDLGVHHTGEIGGANKEEAERNGRRR